MGFGFSCCNVNQFNAFCHIQRWKKHPRPQWKILISGHRYCMHSCGQLLVRGGDAHVWLVKRVLLYLCTSLTSLSRPSCCVDGMRPFEIWEIATIYSVVFWETVTFYNVYFWETVTFYSAYFWETVTFLQCLFLRDCNFTVSISESL